MAEEKVILPVVAYRPDEITPGAMGLPPADGYAMSDDPDEIIFLPTLGEAITLAFDDGPFSLGLHERYTAVLYAGNQTQEDRDWYDVIASVEVEFEVTVRRAGGARPTTVVYE